MFERWRRWLGLRPRPVETVAPTGRLEIEVDGERWRPVSTLVGRGPDERVYLLRVDGDATTVTFGDGQTGRRPRDGARIGSTYRQGIGSSGNDPSDGETNPLRTLLDLFAQMADDLAAAQEQIANEAYLETASGSVIPLSDAEAVRRALESDTGHGIEVRIRFRRWTDRDPP